MAETEPGSGEDHAARELRDTELDRVRGGAPGDSPPPPPAPTKTHEPTKHPAKVTVPDLKL